MKKLDKTTKSQRETATKLSLVSDYKKIRSRSVDLTHHLTEADVTSQSMPDASPTKWHLAHTSWFFEKFILENYLEDYRIFDSEFGKLFNSYYAGAGERYSRPDRGLITRPGFEQVLDYRRHVDRHMERFLQSSQSKLQYDLVTLGLNHEQQHQELLLTDILHLFSKNPTQPTVFPPQLLEVSSDANSKPNWVQFDGGIVNIGNDCDEFCFDSETPRHKALLTPFSLRSKPVTNREWAEFISDGGYSRETLWLSEGWDWCQRESWCAPLYWQQKNDEWWSFTLRGFQPVDMKAPVCHISFYEADAFANWAGARLPTEYEWEIAAAQTPISGNLSEAGIFRPRPQQATSQPLTGLFGDVWEWTASPFRPYPGYKSLGGTVGEYNGKFMSGQMVLRGGCCLTPVDHIRKTYRNFFHPEKRWQFSGMRLAKDANKQA